jgi:hypothetical protein
MSYCDSAGLRFGPTRRRGIHEKKIHTNSTLI